MLCADRKKTAVIVLGLLLHTQKVMAATATGIPKLDAAGNKLVGIMQSVIFWTSMLYTFKSLFEWALKGDDSGKKKVGTGFLICIFDYLIPWTFDVIRGIFQ